MTQGRDTHVLATTLCLVGFEGNLMEYHLCGSIFHLHMWDFGVYRPGVVWDKCVGPVVAWCTAIEWSAVTVPSCSINPGGLVHRLHSDCCEISDCTMIAKNSVSGS